MTGSDSSVDNVQPAPRREVLTALITGASAGIGKAFAEVFAAHGFDVILTARREDRLRALAADLETKYQVRAHVVPADLSDPAAPGRLIEQIEAAGLRVDALVNNAGFGVGGVYGETDWQRQRDFLQVMAFAPCELVQRCLPGMVARHKGYIINLASVVGFMPSTAGATLYAPTKSLLIKFSLGVHTEQEGSGVHVTAVCPGFTHTEFHEAAGVTEESFGVPLFLWSRPEEVAREGFAAVMRNQPIAVIGGVNRLYRFLLKYLPDALLLALLRRGYKRPASR